MTNSYNTWGVKSEKHALEVPKWKIPQVGGPDDLFCQKISFGIKNLECVKRVLNSRTNKRIV